MSNPPYVCDSERAAMEAEGLLRGVLLGLCGLWLCGMLFVYSRNNAVNRQRLELGGRALAQGAASLELPLAPYPEFLTNEQIPKGDLGFLLYRQTPLDVPIRFVDYDSWTAAHPTQ